MHLVYEKTRSHQNASTCFTILLVIIISFNEIASFVFPNLGFPFHLIYFIAPCEPSKYSSYSMIRILTELIFVPWNGFASWFHSLPLGPWVTEMFTREIVRMKLQIMTSVCFIFCNWILKWIRTNYPTGYGGMYICFLTFILSNFFINIYNITI